ncbi:hypothetical protein GCM10009836_65580 [Pseudonocardia ailaonensis]|uniref:KAP NTPase domain-containing protein n=1 Tax=Pseudonocardia ailaonensis TaxID=367279 RepID=A0ABN2NM13_9PSEU
MTSNMEVPNSTSGGSRFDLFGTELPLGPHRYVLDRPALYQEARAELVEHSLADDELLEFREHFGPDEPFELDDVLAGGEDVVLAGIRFERAERLSVGVRESLRPVVEQYERSALRELAAASARFRDIYARFADAQRQAADDERAAADTIRGLIELMRSGQQPAPGPSGGIRAALGAFSARVRAQDKPDRGRPARDGLTGDWRILGQTLSQALAQDMVECRFRQQTILKRAEAAAGKESNAAAALIEWDAARRDLLREITAGMLNIIRAEVARRLGATYTTVVDALPAGGLSSAGDVEQPFATDAFARLDGIMAHRHGASIGLSGPRGAGKSTLMRHVCFGGSPTTEPDGEQEFAPRFGLLLPAPIRYEPREYILHLHEQLCRAILGPSGEYFRDVEPLRPRDPLPRPSRTFYPVVGVCALTASIVLLFAAPPVPGGMLAAVLVLDALGVGAVIVVVEQLVRSRLRMYYGYRLAFVLVQSLALVAAAVATTGLVLGVVRLGFAGAGPLIAVAILAAVGMAALVRTAELRTAVPRRYVEAPDAVPEGQSLTRFAARSRDHDRLLPVASAHLQQLRFSTSYSSDSSATVKAGNTSTVPVGLEAKRGQGVSWQPTALTYPEIIGRLRSLLGTVGEQYEVVIGIDELDKMRSAEDVEAFLNEIKGIFGVTGCYFLVSVSEDAAAAFERRGVAMRDVFDSSFDEILILPFLSFAQSRQLLYAQAGRWTTPLLMLCHVLSGGLPRDLLRVARQVSGIVGRTAGERRVGEIARVLVRDDLVGRCGSVRHEVRRLIGWAAARELYARIPRWEGREVTPDLLRAELHGLQQVVASADPDDGIVDSEAGAVDAQVQQLALELVAVHTMAAVLVEFLEVGYTTDRMKRAEGEIEKSGCVVDFVATVDGLAEARRTVGVDPRLACTQLAAFRAALLLD